MNLKKESTVGFSIKNEFVGNCGYSGLKIIYNFKQYRELLQLPKTRKSFWGKRVSV